MVQIITKLAFPETWSPMEIGESIEGEIFQRDEFPMKDELIPYIDVLPMPIIGVDPVRVFLTHASIKQLDAKHHFAEGGFIKLTYRGESKVIEKRGNYLKHYEGGYINPHDWAIHPENPNVIKIAEEKKPKKQ